MSPHESTQEHLNENTTEQAEASFQQQLVHLDRESELPTPDENQPYLQKYNVRSKLFHLLEDEIHALQSGLSSTDQSPHTDALDLTFLRNTHSNNHIMHCGQILYRLGVNYFDCEESSDSELFLFAALFMLVDDPAPLHECYVPKTFDCTEQSPSTSNTPPPIRLTTQRHLLIALKKDTLLQHLHNLRTSTLDSLLDFVDVFNYFGVIWTNRHEYNTALSFFQHAENLYKEHHSYIFENYSQTHEKLVEMQTLTTFYLAQVYGHLKQIHLAAKYSFLTLKHQLTSGLEYDPVQWVRNAIQLSSYFLSQDDFVMSDHCLHAALDIWKKAKPELVAAAQQQSSEHDSPLDIEDIQNLDANLQLAFARQSFALLEHSKNWIQNWRSHQDKLNKTTRYTEQELFPTERIKIQSFTELTSHMNFEGIPKRDEFYIVISYNDALQAFKTVKKGFESALKFYVLDGFVTEHVKTCQQLSSAYTHLIFYEPNPVRKIAMHKRRAALLDPILDELNEYVYKDTLKVLSFELGQMYSNMHDEYGIMEEKMQEGGTPYNIDLDTLHNQDNEVMLKSIEYFTRFNHYFKDSEGNLEVEEANRPAFVRAHFCLASMYYRIHTKDVEMQRKFLLLSHSEYKFVVQFAEENSVKDMNVELEMAKDMANLLPVKLKTLNGA